MDQQNNVVKVTVLLKVIAYLMQYPLKFNDTFSIEKKIILTFIGKHRNSQKLKPSEQNMHVDSTTGPDFKLSCRATVAKLYQNGTNRDTLTEKVEQKIQKRDRSLWPSYS